VPKLQLPYPATCLNPMVHSMFSSPDPYYPLYLLTGIATQVGKLLHPAGGTAFALSGFEQNRKCWRLHT
jgi:hypothetical protein